jgi:hypothetical protein
MKVDALKLELRVIAMQLFPNMSARAPMFSLTKIPLIEKIVELEKSAEEKGMSVQRLPGKGPADGDGVPPRPPGGHRTRARPGATARRAKRARPFRGQAVEEAAESEDEDADESEGDTPDTEMDEESDEEDEEEENPDDIACATCGKKESTDANPIVLCDLEHCNRGLHIRCMVPPLAAVPEIKWFCPPCVPRTRRGRKSFAKEKLDL